MLIASSGGSGLAPSVLALLTSRCTGPSCGRRVGDGGAVLGIGHVTGHRDDARAGRELGDGAIEAVGAAGVDDEVPPVVGERTRELEAEALRRAGDDGNWSSAVHVDLHSLSRDGRGAVGPD